MNPKSESSEKVSLVYKQKKDFQVTLLFRILQVGPYKCSRYSENKEEPQLWPLFNEIET